jgi:triacylglycerol lipase
MIPWAIVRQCAELCLASYDDNAKGFTSVGDLRFGMHVIDGTAFVTIRGTANASNWLRDADVLPVRSCGSHLAHQGFVDAYRKLCSGGMQTTKGHPEVIATGHSLGGGIATLLAEHTGCRLVTFGSPRVYFRFARVPQIDHARVVNEEDPVPMVPRILYSHKQPPIMLKDNDSLLIDVKDHFMRHYYDMVISLPGMPTQ